MKLLQRKGFTLIEILIVVAIIAILASIVLVGLGPTQQSGRDARRLSDLHEAQNALELYYNKCGFYPGPVQAGGAGTTCAAFGNEGGYANLKAIITGSGLGVNVMPDDPTAGHHYLYAADGTGSSYILGANLENGNNAVFTTYTAPPTAGYTSGDTVTCTAAAKQYCTTL